MKQEQRQTILVTINGEQTTIPVVKKRSSCYDVIYMASEMVDKAGINRNTLALFESCNGNERMLSPNTNILKIIRSWGNDARYSLMLRQTYGIKPETTNMSRAKRTLRRLRSAILSKSTATIDNATKDDTIANNLDCEQKALKCKIIPTLHDETGNSKSPISNPSHPETRVPGDGCSFHDNVNVSMDTCDAHSTGQYQHSVNFEDTDDTDGTGQYQHSVNYEDTDEHGDTDLNAAFIDETLATTWVHDNDDLNQRIYEDIASYEENDFSDTSMCSVDELERNIVGDETNLNVMYDTMKSQKRNPFDNLFKNTTIANNEMIRNMFENLELCSNVNAISPDDIIDSFMNTRVNELDYVDTSSSDDSESESV